MKSGVHKKSQTSSVTTHMQAAAAFPQDHHGCQHCAVVVVHMGQQSTYLENYQTLDCLVSQNHVLPKKCARYLVKCLSQAGFEYFHAKDVQSL